MVRFSEYFQGSTNRTAIKKERKVEDNTKGFGKKKTGTRQGRLGEDHEFIFEHFEFMIS